MKPTESDVPDTIRPDLSPTSPQRDAGRPAQLLADGLAQHAQRWATATGADAATAAQAGRAAQALSLATSEGHVCIALGQLPAWPTANPAGQTGTVAWRAALLASGIVGTPAEPGSRPLVLDDEDRLYLHRDFALERRLAVRLAASLAAPPHPLPPGLVQPQAEADKPDWQALAAALALRSRLTIVSGGPGTGKTTAVVRLLGLLLAQAPDCRIALAAPTGKAAARLTEAIRQRAGGLPPGLQALLPNAASTLHRLLGVSPAARGGPGEGFVHHAGHPLPIDVLVIDEASMLDLALATRVLEAVPAGARVILLGDQDQLSAVESGAVFAELSADPQLDVDCIADLAQACGVAADSVRPPPPRSVSGLRNCVVWFDRNYRFAQGSAIGRLAQDINQGDPARALDWLATQAAAPLPPLVRTSDPVSVTGIDATLAERPSRTVTSAAAAAAAAAATAECGVVWQRDASPTPSPATEALLISGYATYLAAVQAHGLGHVDSAAVLRAFDRFRVLCALRVGPRGVAALNQRLTRGFRAGLGRAFDPDPRSSWYPGRPVMVLRNDPLLQLFNGDIGIALPAVGAGAVNGGPAAAVAASGLEVCFSGPDGSLRRIAPVRLPEHDSAWAMTVHQSQGSEFDAVAVLLPAAPHRVVSRELLYTSVTRARHQVTLVGSGAVIAAAIAAPTRRHSGLTARLREAVATALAPGRNPAAA